MSLARFRISALLENASRPQEATVTIDRASGLFTVRPLRKRTVYTLPLADVASFAVRRIIAVEVAKKRAAKKGGR